MVGVPENSTGEKSASLGSKSKYREMDPELLEDLGDAFIPNHHVENKGSTGTYAIVCTIFASLNHVLLG